MPFTLEQYIFATKLPKARSYLASKNKTEGRGPLSCESHSAVNQENGSDLLGVDDEDEHLLPAFEPVGQYCSSPVNSGMKGKLGLLGIIFNEDEDITFKGFGPQKDDSQDNINDDTIPLDLPFVNNCHASHEVLENASFGATFLHANT